ncbi:hypothetical protein BpHYR1_036811 [Brachionus plicatilis]|uniref:Uncharacterized protein n=1 Tax=Brachionus plicatilis TaxID=10195 RepID=A0A3M7SHQ7_BRAPC|nr:hypothetical protein BpHYR1_036811 [Brachionus plicatilis]
MISQSSEIKIEEDIQAETEKLRSKMHLKDTAITFFGFLNKSGLFISSYNLIRTRFLWGVFCPNKSELTEI